MSRPETPDEMESLSIIPEDDDATPYEEPPAEAPRTAAEQTADAKDMADGARADLRDDRQRGESN